MRSTTRHQSPVALPAGWAAQPAAPAALVAALLATCVWLVLCFFLLVVLIPTETALGLALKIGFTALPLALLWGLYTAGLGGEKSLAALLIVIVVFSELSIRQRAFTDTSADPQNIVKIAIWGAGLLVALLNWKVLRQALREPATALFLVTILWSTVTAVYSPEKLYSLGSGVSMLGVVAFGAVARRSIRESWLIKGPAAALGSLLLIGLVLYVVAPDRAMAPTEGGTVLRLAAPLGTPTQLARAAALVVLLVLVGKGRGVLKASSPLVWIGIPAALACLLLSRSRVATAGLMASLLIVYAMRRPGRGLMITSAVVAVALAFLMFDVGLADLAALVSRTGQISEITTLTGRAEIWSTVWGAILKEPIFGYGYASTKVLLPLMYRTFWGFTVTHAHNMWLQVWFSTGIIGVTLIAATVGAHFRYCWRTGDSVSLAMLVFVLVTGMTEAGHLSGAPSILTAIWALWITGPRPDHSSRTEPAMAVHPPRLESSLPVGLRA